METKTKRILSIFLVVCLMLSTVAGSALAARKMFEDSAGHWAEEAINILADKGVLRGYPDGLVHPDEVVTRGEFAALVSRSLELPEPEEKEVTIVFPDIAGHWAAKDVEALIIAGMIRKDDFGARFLPDEPITRLEMLRILIRAIGRESHSCSCCCGVFADDGSLTDEEKLYICTGKHYHIISGYPDGAARPGQDGTRAEAIEMIVNTDKAQDEAKKEDAQKPPAPKPDEGSSGGGGGGGSHVPAPQFSFTLPKTAYAGEEISVEPASRHVSGVTWTVLKNGLPAELPAVIDGELTAKGGAVKFKEPGSYTLTATAKNSRGREVTCEQTVSIYPVTAAAFTLPDAAHTDTAVAVDLATENLGQNKVVWTLEKDGEAADPAKALSGELTHQGGTVLFVEKGVYTLTASVTDELGKTVTATDTITIYPVAGVKLTLPAVTHTDKTISLKTETKETGDLPPAYSLQRNGEAVELSGYVEGDPAVGDIRFKERGVYALTAAVTDQTGRTFSDTVSITAYPVGSAGFYLPEIFHTDSTVTVEAVFGEIGSHTASWTLQRDGEDVPLSGAVEGALDNSGGRLRFPAKGEYVLRAAFTDGGGRTYSYQQAFRVYPVPTVQYSLPRYAHTDTAIEVRTDTAELDGLTVEWLVDNTYGFQDWPTYVDGSLSNAGGVLHFKRAGTYELVARVTDAAGRVFLFENGGKCEVLPVLAIGFDLPELAYTDTAIDLRTHGNNNVLPVEWSVEKDGKHIPLSEAFGGSLNAQGGKITFRGAGEYTLTAAMTDYLGRDYAHSAAIRILPVVRYSFTMPESVHYGAAFSVTPKDVAHLGSYDVAWTLTKGGEPAEYTGELDAGGGSIAIRGLGSFALTAAVTDSAGRMITHTGSITVTNSPPGTPTLTAAPTRTARDGKFLVELSASAADPDGDAVTLEWENLAADRYYGVGAHTVRVRARDIAGAYSPWAEKTFTIASSAPTVTLAASPTRTVKNGRFLVNISATAADADGDPTTLEWKNLAADRCYSVGTHTVRVRAKDSTGRYSAWAEKTFTIANAAPSTPAISRTPNGNSVAPGTPVTITASSRDPDGDAVTLVWENRDSETKAYPLGKNVVRVKAVDAAGAESPWAAIVFFVADSNGSGGMTLTGPDSVILEQGMAGATITDYTFTVPPVSGHSGSDYGRVRGYNVLTKQWDQLDYGTTKNGITFSRTLGAGVYSQLEFYYFTNHNCMYNKSNITYSVSYHFE